MSEPAPLRLVGPTTGELIDEQLVQQLRDQIAGLETDVRAWRTRFANLQRDRDSEAQRDRLWPVVVDLFGYWRVVAKHPRSEFDHNRFWKAVPFVKRYGPDVVRAAIDGIALDPYVSPPGRNGRREVHNGWALLFRDPDTFERFVGRAPAAVLAKLRTDGALADLDARRAKREAQTRLPIPE